MSHIHIPISITTQKYNRSNGLLPLPLFQSLLSQEKLEYLCFLGHLAPSSHNTQPWRFFIEDTKNTITVYLDRKFILPASDIEGRQATISIGCAVENILLGAQYYGYTATTTLTTTAQKTVLPAADGEPTLTEILQIQLATGMPQPSLEPMAKAIFNRKIVRAEYDPTRKIPETTLEIIKQIAKTQTITLQTIVDSTPRLTIAELQSQADAYVINSPEFSRELGGWLLPNDSTNNLGMTGITFGLQDDEAIRLHEGLSGKTALQPEDGLKFATGGKIFFEKSPLIGVITTKHDTIENWIQAGQIFEKIFLELTTSGIQLAVHAGITEVPLIKKIFTMTMATNEHPTIIFRAGYAKNNQDLERPFSARLPLEEIILTDKPSP